MTDLLHTRLESYQTAVHQAISEIEAQNIIGRIWDHDYTVWQPEPTEITNRLGWLHLPQTMMDNLVQIQTLVELVKLDGYTHVLLLGMGGSSLAPEVFSKTFGPNTDGLHLEVLDSTHPDTILDYANKLDYARTLFIVSTKSGGTVETQSFFKYFYNQAAAELGDEEVGKHFIAITDPGSKLERQANDYNFRQTFLNDPNIGGRYSVLSYFGLVPAALVGVDIEKLLQRAGEMTGSNGNEAGALLGAVLGECAKNGRDKLTLITSPQISSFGDWVEQLVAESTGKIGKGILPVVGEPLGTAEVYGQDRLFM
jgi:glucose-6-phosphate isomerase